MANKKEKATVTTLAANPNTALREMITHTKALIEFADMEMRALIQNDMMQLFVLQSEKDRLAQNYTQASSDFRTRVDDFKQADKGLLNQLEKLQDDLNKKTNENNKMIQQAYQKSRSKTQDTLLSVQELAQSHPVRFEDDTAAQQAGG